jgi:hypothetical protein
VVVASQLPLTVRGSVTLAVTFYRSLLSGDDVRAALHEARVSLREAEKTGHDWVSLVSYVRLPEGYSDHLMEVNLKCQLAMLNAARRKAEAILLRGAGGAELEPIEELVRERIAVLNRQGETIPRERADLRAELAGLLGSAYKRLAELQFRRGSGVPRDQDLLSASRSSLEESLRHYREEYESNLSHHWTGIQRLALEAVLNGRIEERPWLTVELAAELALVRPEPDRWAYGTLAELQLLARVAGRDPGLARASEFLTKLMENPPDGAVASTRYQLEKYVNWWTREHGFFAGNEDLADDARDLMKVLA